MTPPILSIVLMSFAAGCLWPAASSQISAARRTWNDNLPFCVDCDAIVALDRRVRRMQRNAVISLWLARAACTMTVVMIFVRWWMS